ncbi:hypothetical protein Axi01nite_50190 [Actinoplanes xinjiangensis]|nr:hypothetical protein Axi01nite_50190 [Actinoplanes xinjiangensis]
MSPVPVTIETAPAAPAAAEGAIEAARVWSEGPASAGVAARTVAEVANAAATMNFTKRDSLVGNGTPKGIGWKERYATRFDHGLPSI